MLIPSRIRLRADVRSPPQPWRVFHRLVYRGSNLANYLFCVVVNFQIELPFGCRNVLFKVLETVVDMLRDPDKQGQHELMGWDGRFNVEKLELGFVVNYLSAAPINQNLMYKTIGILTGGGDAPGLNAVIRAVVKTATGEYGMRVIGIEDGFEGLLGETRTRPLTPGDVRGLLPRGGTILGTRNRGKFVEHTAEGVGDNLEGGLRGSGAEHLSGWVSMRWSFWAVKAR